MCAGIKTNKINVLLISSVYLLIVRISSENDIVQLHLKVQKLEGNFSVELNCITKEEPFPSVGVFYSNNVSLANISPFNGTCYISQVKCRSLQCECGLKYFNYRHTSAFDITESIFTCELRFNKSTAGYKKHVAVRASVFYNNSGSYKMKEILEEKGPDLSDTKQDTDKDDVKILIGVITGTVIVVLALPIIVYCLCKRTKLSERCRNFESPKTDNDEHVEIKNDSRKRLTETEEIELMEMPNANRMSSTADKLI